MRKIFKKPFKPKNVIDYYQKKAEEIRQDNLYNYEYTYWMKTPKGMLIDEPTIHEYGSSRAGFEQWKMDHPTLMASVGGKISIRPIVERSCQSRIVGYVTEEQLSDSGWQDEILQLSKDCFDKLCEELDVKDRETFRFFIFHEMCGYENYADELRAKISAMTDVYESYQNDEEYKQLIDKIKG